MALPAEREASRFLLVLFSATIFLAAALLFAVQPMVGKMVLPRLGGSPEVWNTSMVFFQLALLGGYLYAHWSIRALGTRRQAQLHSALLFLPLLALPITFPAWSPPSAGVESPWLIAVLVTAVGAPFLALATASPLLQRWFTGTRHEAARDPYFLYGASNAGSLVGLLAYPFLLEPFFQLGSQTRIWAIGYTAFVLLSGVCAFSVVRSAGTRTRDEVESETDATVDRAPSVSDRVFWMACAFAPSCLLLGATHYLTTDVAPVPLLWVLPLAVYVATFIVAFSRRPLFSERALSRWMAVAAVALTLALLGRVFDPLWFIVLLHLGGLAISGLLCHTRLAQARPAPNRLTDFYLFVAVGGVLGGAFAALVAPRIFNDLIEYPIAIVLACMLRVPDSESMGRSQIGRVLDLALPAGLAAFVFATQTGAELMGNLWEGPFVILTASVPAFLCYLLSPHRARFALGITVLLAFAYSVEPDTGERLHAERTFFGVHRVSRDREGRFTVLMHGSTIHGIQSTDPALARRPLGYYHPAGPGGQVVRALAASSPESRVAFVGLGTGALAVLTAPRQRVTFYEIDATVVEIAGDPRWFSYLAHTPAPYDIVIGDGRISLAASEAQFDLIVLDAFSSAAIPVHLLTREAVAMYLERLAPGGALLFHVSNEHLALGPVLAQVAAALGLAAVERFDLRSDEDQGVFGSHWVLMAREPADLGRFVDDSWRFLLPIPGAPLWTDQFSNVLSVFRWPTAS